MRCDAVSNLLRCPGNKGGSDSTDRIPLGRPPGRKSSRPSFSRCCATATRCNIALPLVRYNAIPTVPRLHRHTRSIAAVPSTSALPPPARAAAAPVLSGAPLLPRIDRSDQTGEVLRNGQALRRRQNLVAVAYLLPSDRRAGRLFPEG